jgi:hypothetical protein
MDVGKEREQERKLFRRSDCRKRPPWLTPGGLIPAYSCIPLILVGHAGGTTPRMGEVESRQEQRSRAPTVGALGAASAPAHAKYLHPCRQCRSNCREHGVLYCINSVSSVFSVVNYLFCLIWVMLSLSRTQCIPSYLQCFLVLLPEHLSGITD